MPNAQLARMLSIVDDKELTEARRINNTCIAFAAWASEMRQSNEPLGIHDQLANLDITLLLKALAILKSKDAAMHLANMFSDPAFADIMLGKLTSLIDEYTKTTHYNRPLPKPPTSTSLFHNQPQGNQGDRFPTTLMGPKK